MNRYTTSEDRIFGDFKGVPEDEYNRPISKNLLRAAGINPESPRSELRLAQLHLPAYLHKGSEKWQVQALVPKTELPIGIDDWSGEWRRLGSASLDASVGIDEVMEVADEWLRDNDATEWLPTTVMRSVQPYDNGYGTIYQAGAVLLRAETID